MKLSDIDNYMIEKQNKRKDTEPVTFRVDRKIRLMWQELCKHEHREPGNMVEILVMERYKQIFGEEKFAQALSDEKQD
jgi:hypothetical protein